MLAKRFQMLEAEIRDHDTILDDLTRSHAPTMREAIGIGADTAAEMLIVFGDNLERIHSDWVCPYCSDGSRSHRAGYAVPK